MTDRPIIFSAPMVNALLQDRKSQTRRLATSPLRNCRPGDRLWVRESWYCDHDDCQVGPYQQPPGYSFAELVDDGFLHFGATMDPRIWECGVPPMRPSIHMPRWASRLTLSVEDVRHERLQDISEADALAEGVGDDLDGPVAAYARLWSLLHGPESWLANPDVVAITFTVVTDNIDQVTP